MTTEELSQYPEFEAIRSMNNVDASAYLMKLATRYNKIVEIAKKTALELVEDCNNKDGMIASDGTRIVMHTKETSKVQTDILKASYPELYKELCDKGEVSISTKSIKGRNVEGVTTTTVSKYLSISLP